LSQRKAVTKAVATRYRRANRSRKKPRDGTDLDVSDEVAAALVVMSPATMNRRLAADRAAMTLPGRGHTEPPGVQTTPTPAIDVSSLPVRASACSATAMRGRCGGGVSGPGCGSQRWSAPGCRSLCAFMICGTVTRPGFSDGVPINLVQYVMGHERASTTLDLYTHAPSGHGDRLRAVADFRLTPAMSGGPETVRGSP